ncbi:Hypothetical_protein [Hexamita inflata]|uniref:Hypothetical_protein n=1 Tax=Hexamita inflata TaxID=28002 RepID=A0AA86NPA7_9EUKA|nr:Hypothetical protein HINF_LOCUS10283 [Hexamita inflata]
MLFYNSLKQVKCFRTDKINLEFQSIYKLLQTSLNDCSEQSWNERIRMSSSLELYVSFVEAQRILSLSIMKASLSPSSRNLCNQRRRKRQTIISELSIIKTPTNIIYENRLNYSHTNNLSAAITFHCFTYLLTQSLLKNEIQFSSSSL